MRLRGLLLAAVCAALALVPGALPAATATQLFGTVGPGFSITLTDANGTVVTRVDPGIYDLVVRDLSPDHNFHIFGPGVEEFTGVEAQGTVTWTLTLREGRYTIQCDPHPTVMTRQLTVGDPPVITPPTPPPALPKLLATVGPRATISLRSATGAVLRNGVKTGSYAIVVRDRTKAHNFHLVGKSVNRRTTVAGTGTVTWKVKLLPGLLRFYSDRAPLKIRGSIRVRA